MSNVGDKATSGKRMTLVSLLQEGKLHIEIPRLQRDYAQGRRSEGSIRSSFLNALRQYLDEGRKNRDLDFIYGSIERKGEETVRFIPLDGQQRLTTLFLLHWYLAQHDGEQEAFRSVFADQEGSLESSRLESKFVYETRTSAREFCNTLVGYDLPESTDSAVSVSRQIMNEPWFFRRWSNDPTIYGMLAMLDAIQEKFRDTDGYYDRLAYDSVVTFLFLELREFGLTDDLYLKMNSRGKPLTAFENFKAKLEQYIEKQGEVTLPEYRVRLNGEETALGLPEYFAHKIDTDWADFFWAWRNAADSDNTFDTELLHFVQAVLLTSYVSSLGQDRSIDTIKRLVSRQALTEPELSFEDLVGLSIISMTAIRDLISALDAISKGPADHALIETILSGNPSYQDRIVFYGYQKYLVDQGRVGPIDEKDLAQWMRVLRNLTNNTIINGPEELVRAVDGIDAVFPMPGDTLSFLRSSTDTITGFFSSQVMEERIKAHLISRSSGWREGVLRMDAHPYFEGQIGFLLEFAGILDYYNAHSDCDWSDQEDSDFLDRFSDMSHRVTSVFTLIHEHGSRDLDYVWERAVFTTGDYMLDAGHNRWNLLSTSRYKRDYSWKRLLRIPATSEAREEAVAQAERRGFVRALLTDDRFDPDDVQRSLSTIIDQDGPEDWRRYFVIASGVALFGYSEQGFVVLDDETDFKILGASQRNHYHVELVSYSYYIRKLKDSNDLHPFVDPSYYQVRTQHWDYPAAVLGELTYRGTNYATDIRYRDNLFELRFFCRDGDSQYRAEIVEAVTSIGMEKTDIYNDLSYALFVRTESELDDAVGELRRALQVIESGSETASHP